MSLHTFAMSLYPSTPAWRGLVSFPSLVNGTGAAARELDGPSPKDTELAQSALLDLGLLNFFFLGFFFFVFLNFYEEAPSVTVRVLLCLY